MSVHGLEPTNNTVDRALRPGVIYEKLSFGTQGRYGTRYLERLLKASEIFSIAGPKCLREVGVHDGGQVQTGKVHLRFSMPPGVEQAAWNRTTGPLTDTGPKQPIQINTSGQHRSVNDYLSTFTQ
jgi:hypothetical protein